MKDCGGKNLAIAYAMKRKKMARGGVVTAENERGVNPPLRYDENKGISNMGQSVRSGDYDEAKKEHHETMKEMSRMKKPKIQGLAEGGFAKDEEESGYEMMPEDQEMHNHAAMTEDDQMLGQPEEEGDQTDDHEMDMVGRIMKQRQHMYSKGGMVANGGEDELDHMADGDDNQFDYLASNDDLEDPNTGDNSGDKLDNSAEDHDREDIISRIMKSRAKKDRLPNPR